ncbi:hypothetical protein [Kutzneria sp. NPDC052558]|uniref:hypothetical protein n=1 Tax=Kutzneria sp. NPDC052558 TaxID=3364121 RepID=UPI0037C815F4
MNNEDGAARISFSEAAGQNEATNALILLTKNLGFRLSNPDDIQGRKALLYFRQSGKVTETVVVHDHMRAVLLRVVEGGKSATRHGSVAALVALLEECPEWFDQPQSDQASEQTTPVETP